MSRKLRTFGTYNTHDGEGRGLPFADVIVFTEAGPGSLRHLKRTHDLHVCRWQRDLVVAVKRDLDVGRVRTRYRLSHPGVPLVTPHRGVWLLWFEREVPDVIAEHRINAAHEPFRRGERWFRSRMWKRSQRIAERIARRRRARGRDVIAAGDPNAPRGVLAWPSLPHEVGVGFDRIASTLRLVDVKTFPGVEAVHPLLRTRVLS